MRRALRGLLRPPPSALRALCAEHGIALIEEPPTRRAPRRGAALARGVGLAGCFSFFSNKVLVVRRGRAAGHRRRRGRRARAQPALTRHDVDAPGTVIVAMPRATTSSAGLQLPHRRAARRAALRASRASPGHRRAPRSWCVATASCLRAARRDRALHGRRGRALLLLRDAGDAGRRRAARGAARRCSRRRVQTSVLYPAMHEFTRLPAPEPTSRAASRSLAPSSPCPSSPRLSEADQDSVVAALAEGVRRRRPPAPPRRLAVAAPALG